MIAGVHIAVGAAIGAKTNSFLLGGLLSLVSHFILDRFPHFDFGVEGNKLKLINIIGGLSDFFISFFLIFILFSKFPNFYLIFFGAFMAILPDIVGCLKFFFKLPFLNWYFDFHDRIQGPWSKVFGAILQILIIILSLFVIFY